MDMVETVRDRLVKYLKHKGIGQNAFEKAVGISNGYISHLKSTPGPVQLEKILRYASDLNRVWLLSGDGEMIAGEESNVTPFVPERVARVPVVSQYAHAGYLTGYADPEYIQALPTIDFTPDREMTGNYIAFEIRGDSMNDGSKEGYVDGELVICREVEPYLWQGSRLHINKRDFVIVHSEGILIKRITEHDVERHRITVHSLNPEYPDRVIDLADVRQIFSVVESRVQRKR